MKPGDIVEVRMVMKVESVRETGAHPIVWGYTEKGTYCVVAHESCKVIQKGRRELPKD